MMTTIKIENPSVGTNTVRPDGVDKVTGRAIYGADVRLPNMTYGRVKRSPHAHALIKSIDITKALALPGVLSIVTSEDFPSPVEAILQTIRGPMPAQWDIERLMARRKVLFRGHPVAAVSATDAHIAEDAVELIEVEYEVLPPVVTIEDALSPNAPILHDDGMDEVVEDLFIPVDGKPSNIARTVEMGFGDIEEGFSQADIILERVYELSLIHI